MRSPLLVSLALALAVPAVLPLTSLPALASPARGGLPRLSPTVLPAPEPAAVAELDQALKLVTSPKPGDHEAGMARLKDGGEKLLPAIARRLSELKRTLNKEQAATYITEARKGRKKGDKDEEKEAKPKKKKGAPAPPPTEDIGWLPLLLATPHADQPYRDLLTVLSLERALVDLGTTPAARELIGVFVQYGELLRIDVQHMMARLGDRAVPALLEARKHDAEKVRHWAVRQLDAIGKAVPGETVQITDQDVLADVLRAYGRTRDIDALRVVVSFCSSDRQQVRDAAREALVNYGDAALWQLREALENLTGKRPPAGTAWDKLALDLFESHDRARLEEIFHIFEEGQARQKEGKLDEMAASFDAVLARAPSFDRRSEMVDGYLALARKIEPDDRPRAALLARKALRLDPQGPQARATEAYLLTLEAEQLAADGLVDTAPLKRAIEIDPSNARPRDLLARLEASPQARAHGGYRYLAAAAIGAIAVIASLLIGLVRPRVAVASGPLKPAPAPEPSAGPSGGDSPGELRRFGRLLALVLRARGWRRPSRSGRFSPVWRWFLRARGSRTGAVRGPWGPQSRPPSGTLTTPSPPSFKGVRRFRIGARRGESYPISPQALRLRRRTRGARTEMEERVYAGGGVGGAVREAPRLRQGARRSVS